MKTKIRAILFILLIILIHAKLCATAQVSDVIILGTENNRLLTNPLESLFFKKPELKEKYKNIRSKYDALIATNCWRGYIAKFKIVGSALYVVDVTIEISVPPADNSSHFQTKNISIFSELFETENAVFCDFYSGMLIVPQGAMVKYVHGGYLSEYEKYILIKITDGKIFYYFILFYIVLDIFIIYYKIIN